MDISDYRFPLGRESSFRELSPSVHWAQLHVTRKFEEYALRRIYDYELLYVKQGQITAALGGQQLPVHPGQLLIIPSGVHHSIVVETMPEAVFLGIHFDFFDELDIVIDQDIIVKDELFDPERCCREPLIPGFKRLSAAPVVTPSAAAVAEMELLIAEFADRQPGFEAVCKGLMQQLLVKLFRMQAESAKRFHAMYGERFQTLMEWIELNYRQDCSNARLAELVRLNEDYMAKLFRAASGMPPGKYVQKVRHRAAKRLLQETDETIESVGSLVGYPDIHYFSRMFTKWEGSPPRDYRNLSRIY
ncbi:AraC family transcriptional regulator [Paenibacillus silvisoli]|uniref:AraC family transcriptional regulator n=1 Tax=Paenibacillus silvisoli TaxID=3110539 RepID=UPI0028051512|nr:AraC family transcriptional regulator [Paenibacillus silvisoli]